MKRMLQGTIYRAAVSCTQSVGASKQVIGSLLSASETVCSSSSRANPSFDTNGLRSASQHCRCSRSFSTSAIASRTTGKGGNDSSGSSAALFFALPCLFTAFLGTWQVNRRQWKVDLLKTRTASLEAEAVEFNELPNSPNEFTRVHIQGQFDHCSSIFVGPRPRSNMGSATNGYTLITPLRSAHWDKPVLVSRGWVPATWRSDPSFRKQFESSSQAEVSLEGVTRSSEDPSSFVPQNNPKSGEWFWIDVPGMATSLGLPADTPLVEAVSVEKQAPPQGHQPTTMDVLGLRTTRPLNEEQYPITRSIQELMTFKVTPDDHRNYALTWYTLSAATGTMAYGILKKRKGR